jgi:hypothetical protein
MKNAVIPQTGPKTALGKKIASKNAQKAAIFTRGYLPSENIEEKQAQFEALANQWGAHDPTRLMILRTIEQAHLGIERQMVAEREIIEGAMQSLDMAQAFVQAAGLSPMMALTIPSWFFEADAVVMKNFAIQVYKAYSEINYLKNNFSDSLVAQVNHDYPEAFAYVMEGQRANASFLTVLGKRYHQPTPVLNLAAAINEINEKYRDHLIWARDPKRYEMIISSLRSKKIRELIDWDKSNRYAVSLQNRIFKGIQGLALLDQHERFNAENPLADELPNPCEKDASEEAVIVDEEHS